MIDWLILSTALVVALFNRGGAIVAIWFGSSVALFWWYEGFTKWSMLVDWANYHWMKDLALMFLAGYLRAPLIIVLGLAASCLFHQITSWQIFTYTWENVTLFDYRSDFMLYLSVIMLATAITDIIGGGSNGGRNARNIVIPVHYWLGRVLRYASQKVIK